MLTGAIIAQNESTNIEKALQSLQFCDEIIVIDNSSTDNTSEVAKKNGAKVFFNESKDNFSLLRNFAMEKSKGEWILFIDADEIVTKELQHEILNALHDSTMEGFYLKRRDIWLGKKIEHGEAGKISLLRLVKKNSGKWQGKVHEIFVTSEKTGQLANPLIHYPHQTLTEFILDINTYSSLRAKELNEQGLKSSLFQIIVYPAGKFIMNYFFKAGFLDGTVGFSYAFLMSFHSFLVRSKLYQLQDK